MRIIVSDSSCLIDLQKGGLLRAMFELPYAFSIPQPLFERELSSLSKEAKSDLVQAGMEVINLSGEQVLQASVHYQSNSKLHLNDCFALALAEHLEDAILFTGDAPLRKLAEEKDIETHGVIWAIDQLEEFTDTPDWLILDALTMFLLDEMIWLPEDELQKRIRRLRRKSN